MAADTVTVELVLKARWFVAPTLWLAARFIALSGWIISHGFRVTTRPRAPAERLEN